jgi:hypothetical protein
MKIITPGRSNQAVNVTVEIPDKHSLFCLFIPSCALILLFSSHFSSICLYCRKMTYIVSTLCKYHFLFLLDFYLDPLVHEAIRSPHSRITRVSTSACVAIVTLHLLDAGFDPEVMHMTYISEWTRFYWICAL